MFKKINIFHPNVFMLAIMVSFFWHLLWLSTIKVVAAPGKAAPVRFSKVSFLGPVLARDNLELRIEPTKRSILEKRYLAVIEKLPRMSVIPIETIYHKDGMPDIDRDIRADMELASFVDGAVSGKKSEPSLTD